MVRLHERAIDAISRKFRLPEGFREEAAIIPDTHRMDQDQTVQPTNFLEFGHFSP